MFEIKNFLISEKIDNIKSYSNGQWLNIIVGTARSSRHILSILNKVKLSKIMSKRDIFGLPEHGWVIFSANQTDIHLFTNEKRQYYDIDKLWGNYELQ